jgi:hypothetical protein
VGGVLLQNTLQFANDVGPYYLLNGTFDHHFPATLEWRIKVGHNQAQAVDIGLGTPNRYWLFNIADYGVEVPGTCGGCWNLAVSMDTTDAFHTYRVVISADSDTYDLFVDGQFQFSGAAGISPGDTYFGDGTLSGGNASAEWDYITLVNPVVSYEICALYDQSKLSRAGSTIPIKLQLCDANGVNQSSPTIIVKALSVTRVSTNTTGPVEDAGNANPDDDFRYDASLGVGGGYIFNLSTIGYSPGTYRLNFKAGDDPSTHFVQFGVR